VGKVKMNKEEFVGYISGQHKCTKKEAERIINIFSTSVIGAMAEGKGINLAGFGIFSVNKLAARKGRNPRTGEGLDIVAHNQPKFKAGVRLKKACNELG
jgi:DNA-binding protein HU-beta